MSEYKTKKIIRLFSVVKGRLRQLNNKKIDNNTLLGEYLAYVAITNTPPKNWDFLSRSRYIVQDVISYFVSQNFSVADLIEGDDGRAALEIATTVVLDHCKYDAGAIIRYPNDWQYVRETALTIIRKLEFQHSFYT